MSELQRLRKAFRTFADDCQETSPLYEFLSKKVAEDEDLLKLCQYRQDGQPAPNILFGTVHHLLLNGAQHSFAKGRRNRQTS